METASDSDPAHRFDFRSSLFQRDANWLALVTGQALWLCRQELFIAEGVVPDALGTLLSGPGRLAGTPALH